MTASRALKLALFIDGAEHAIVQIAKKLHRIGAHIAVVFDHEDRFLAGAFHSLGCPPFFIITIDVPEQAWKVNFDSRPFADLAVDLYVAF